MPASAEKFIQDITRKAGEAALKRFGTESVRYMKSADLWDVVTNADLLSEKFIIDAIRKQYPDHGIISEERGSIGQDAEYVWIIDPVDGTRNYAFGMPIFGVMVCLAHKGEVILSAIAMPATREFFFAKKDGGAYLNGKRIRCSRTSRLAHSFGVSSSSIRRRSAAFVKAILALPDSQHMLLGAFGAVCANGCAVAAGRRDWMVQVDGQIWDYAPISLMLTEAGCKVTDTKGRPWRLGMSEFVAANPKLHKELLKLTKHI
jgi:myo-inositol-1(or 4)-monophosphatase